jgi:hypothetical protein
MVSVTSADVHTWLGGKGVYSMVEGSEGAKSQDEWEWRVRSEGGTHAAISEEASTPTICIKGNFPPGCFSIHESSFKTCCSKMTIV